MPLLLSSIEDELTKLMDKDDPTFIGFPTNTSSAATNWITAIDNYAGVNVLPASTSSGAAKTAAISYLAGAGGGTGTFLPALISAMTIYAAALAGGMSPSFTGTPPPIAVDFTALLALPLTSPNSLKISTLAGIIHSWFITGTAVPSGGGSPINWN